MSELEREKFEARFPPPPKEMKTALSHWIAKRDGWLARSESAPSDLRRAWEQGRVESARVNCKLCASDRPELILDVKGNHRYKEDGAWYSVCASAEIWKLKWPGESAHAMPISHDVLAGAAVAGRHEKAATADPGQRSTVGPEDIQGEAASPAPGWQIYKSLAEKVEDGEVSIDSLCDGSYSGSPAPAPTEKLGICGKNNSPHLPGWYCTNWHEVEAAPAPTEPKNS